MVENFDVFVNRMGSIDIFFSKEKGRGDSEKKQATKKKRRGMLCL